MPFGIGFGEMLLIFAVLLLVFGAKRLPEIGGAMGKSIRDFKQSISGLDGEPTHPSISDRQAPPPAQAAPRIAEAPPEEARREEPRGNEPRREEAHYEGPRHGEPPPPPPA